MRPNGGPLPTTFSYHASRSSNEHNTGRIDEGKPPGFTWARRLPGLITLVALLAATGFALSLNPRPKVIILDEPATITRQSDEYMAGITQIWKDSLTNYTKLTVDTRQITSKINQKFPEINSVNIEIPLLGRRPTLVISAGKPALELINSQGSFFVDENGKVMAERGHVTANQVTNLPAVRDSSELSVNIGEYILPSNQVRFMVALNEGFRQTKIKTTSLNISKDTANQLEVRVEGKGYYLKFDLLGDPREQLGTYLAAQEKIDAKEYVDLRVPEKLFYR